MRFTGKASTRGLRRGAVGTGDLRLGYEPPSSRSRLVRVRRDVVAAVDVVRFATTHAAVLGRTRHLTRRWERTYVGGLIVLDACAAFAAGVLTYAERFLQTCMVWLSSPLPPVSVAGLAANRAYESRYLGFGSGEFRRVMTAAVWLVA